MDVCSAKSLLHSVMNLLWTGTSSNFHSEKINFNSKSCISGLHVVLVFFFFLREVPVRIHMYLPYEVFIRVGVHSLNIICKKK